MNISYNSLLKTSIDTRINVYSKQLQNGMLTPNEIRRKENLPEVEAGDTLFIQSNLLPLKPETIDSFMASARLKLEEIKNINTDTPGVEGNHSAIGDDKGM